MKMKTTLGQSVSVFILFAGLLTGAVSCKKEKNENNVPPPVNTEKIKEFKTGEEFIRFEYAAAGEINKVIIKTDINTGGAALTYNVTHAGNKIASLETPGEKIVPVYENNVMTRADIFQNNERVGYTSYYYYENSALKKATIYFGENNDFDPFLEFNFTYNGAGNVAETVAMMANGEPGQMVRSGHITYQYDQKANPLFAQKDLLALFWQTPSKNNITVENHFDADLQPEDKFVYNYTYNTNGLPKSAVVTQGLPGQPPVTSNVQYIY